LTTIDPRLTQKAMEEEDGDFRRVHDVVRGSIVVNSLPEIDRVIDMLNEQGIKIAKPPSNRLENPGPDGYRDIKLNPVMSTGHVTELQIIPGPIFYAKETKGHKLYDDVRPLLAKLKREGRQPIGEESTILASFLASSAALYGAGWLQTIQRSGRV
jgi:hypothetical protein